MMMNKSPDIRLRAGAFTTLTASLWSFVIFPVIPAYSAYLSPPTMGTSTEAVAFPAPPGNIAPEGDGQTDERFLADLALSAGSVLAGGSGHTDMGDVASGRIRGAAAGVATGTLEQWLREVGNARIRVDIDRNFTLKNSEFDFLLPWHQSQDRVVFTQQSIHRTDDRTQVNLGTGVRHFGQEWMTGINAFYDHDLTRYHRRAGIGAELWRDYLKFSANGYFRFSNWRSAPELNNDYEARPANGWDIRAEGWPAVYPQLGAKVTVEQYYGKEVALSGTDNRRENPYAITAGLNWTPVPLVTLSGERSTGRHDMHQSRFGLQLNYTPGMSWARHLDPDAVRERRTLAGSRLDLVERNNHIILEYRRKELIRLALRERVEGTPGQEFSLVTGLQTRYPLQGIVWNAGSFLAAGGEISGSGTATQFILPAWRPGSDADDTTRLNTYTITAVARDCQGNRSEQAESTLVVQDTGVRVSDLRISSGAQANGVDINTATAIVTDSAGRTVAGETVIFTLPPQVSAATTSKSVPAGTKDTARSSLVRVITDNNGIAVLNLISLEKGTWIISAQAGSSPVRSAPTTFNENTDSNTPSPDIPDMRLSVRGSNVLADGLSAYTLNVALTDPVTGSALEGHTVNFGVTPDGSLSAVFGKTDRQGNVSVTLTSTSAGSHTVTAGTGDVERTVDVTFVAVQLQGTLAANPASIRADDTTQSTLSLILTDQNGKPQPGKTVAFSSSLPGTTMTPVTDRGDGTYTAKLKGTTPGTTTVNATVDGASLTGASAMVTLVMQPAFTITASTHINPENFSANSGFPTTGFTGATFTVNTRAAPSDYNWTVKAGGNSNPSWLSVEPATGIVTFNSRPSSAEKTVEIVATPKTGGQPLGYRFTVDRWFISHGATRMNWNDADTFCRNTPGYRLPARADVTDVTGGPENGRRGTGRLWTEWGDLTRYPGFGLTGTGYAGTWMSESYNSSRYLVSLRDGYLRANSVDALMLVTCLSTD